MKLFTSKQNKVEAELDTYCQKVAFCLEQFRKAVESYCRSGDRTQLERDFNDVHHAESLADDLRRDIEVLMYAKSVFPESRGDILNLLETMDKVPNQAESALRMILTHYIVIPDSFRSGVLQLVDISHRCTMTLIEGVVKLFSDFTNATVAVGKVDEIESECDNLEAQLIEQIFSGDLEGIDKLLLRDLVKAIGSICDRAENAGDRIRIIVAKRSV